MDYKSMAQEYYDSAERLKTYEEKYEKLAQSSGKHRWEYYNSKAFYYHLRRADALRIAKLLEEKEKSNDN